MKKLAIIWLLLIFPVIGLSSEEEVTVSAIDTVSSTETQDSSPDETELTINENIEDVDLLSNSPDDIFNINSDEKDNNSQTRVFENHKISLNPLQKYNFNFSVMSDSATIFFRFMNKFIALGAIIDRANLASFLNNQNVPAYVVFDKTFGVAPVILRKGEYSLVIQNLSNTVNIVGFEIDIPRSYSDATRIDTLHRAINVPKGSAWQEISVISGTKLWVDGLNSGVDFFIVDDENLLLARNNQTFQYFKKFEPTFGNMNPTGFEVDLPDGNYFLFFRNSNNQVQNVSYTLELFSTNNSTTPPNSPPNSPPESPVNTGNESGGSINALLLIILVITLIVRMKFIHQPIFKAL